MKRTKKTKAKPITTLAYCWATGVIEFTDAKLPSDALPIARGPSKDVREFIDVKSRHGYQTHEVNGRTTRIPGTDCLLVPGVPEEPDQLKKVDALRAWMTWIKPHAPAGVRVMA